MGGRFVVCFFFVWEGVLVDLSKVEEGGVAGEFWFWFGRWREVFIEECLASWGGVYRRIMNINE